MQVDRQDRFFVLGRNGQFLHHIVGGDGGVGEHQHHHAGRLDCVDDFLPPQAGAVDAALVNPHPYPGRAHPLHELQNPCPIHTGVTDKYLGTHGDPTRRLDVLP